MPQATVLDKNFDQFQGIHYPSLISKGMIHGSSWASLVWDFCPVYKE